MSCSSNVINLNKKAVMLMREGQSQAAVCALNEALSRVRARLHVQKQQRKSATGPCIGPSCAYGESSDCCMDDQSMDTECQKPRRRLGASATVQTVAIDSLEASQASPENFNVFEFYPRAFVLRNRQEGQQRHSSKTEYLVLLFNLAVTHHQAGIHAESNTKVLQGALGYYNMAQTVLRCMWDHLDSSLRLLMALAITNNVGHVHSQLLDYQETRNCLEAVRRLLDEATAVLSHADYVFFSRTALIFNNDCFSVAPAA